MSEKPEALRLADELDVASLGIKGCLESLSAAEHRRQHAEIERLRDELRQSSIDHTRAEVERLKAVALQAQNAAIDLAKENERLREALPYDWDQLEACRGSLREHMAEIERLKADNERLREALEKIADASMSMHLNAAHMATSLQGIAKAALRREDKT